MESMSVVVAVAVAALLTAGMWGLIRRSTGSLRRMPPRVRPSSDSSQQRVIAVFRGERLAALVSLIVGVAVAAMLGLIGSWWPRGYGLPYALAGSAAAVLGLLTYTLYPRRSWSPGPGGRTIAELMPRVPTVFARQWVFLLPLVSAVALILGLLLTGLYSSTDEKGLHRAFQRRSLSGWGVENGQVVDVQYNLSSTGPFPGWYYGIPVMVGTILLIGVVYWSLRRIAQAARPASADLFDADTSLRSLQITFVMTASSAALAFQVAGLAAITGSVLRIAHRDSIPTANLTAAAGTVPVEPGHTLALALILSSLVVVVVAVVLLIKAISVITCLWSMGRREDRLPEPVR